jgi:response regulator NasT
VSKSKLRVMLIDENAARADELERALAALGYEVAVSLGSGEGLHDRVLELRPDVIIIDMESPSRDTLEHVSSVSRHRPLPIVMFANDSDSTTIDMAVRAGVTSYVVDGLSEKRLKPIMEVAIARFKAYESLRAELEKTKADLAERKVIEKAKGIIMKQRQCNEEEAFRAMRKLAMDRNKRLIDVARDVIAFAELFG